MEVTATGRQEHRVGNENVRLKGEITGIGDEDFIGNHAGRDKPADQIATWLPENAAPYGNASICLQDRTSIRACAGTGYRRGEELQRRAIDQPCQYRRLGMVGDQAVANDQLAGGVAFDTEAGIRVEFLCPDDARRFFAGKFPDETLPELP